MLAETITLSEALHIIDSGQVFAISYCTADHKRGTAGIRKTYSNCIKNSINAQQAAAQTKHCKASPKATPALYDNSTRRLKLMRTREIKTVHIRLITHLNGKRII
jgi:hypothetical protein